MKKHPILRYRGVAVMGCPGSGKTSAGEALSRVLKSRHRLVEASRAVIYPVADLQEWPVSAAALLKKLASAAESGRLVRRPSRDDARGVFSALSRRYSPSMIAQALVHLQEAVYGGDFLIISGLRGFDNAAFLKERGFLIVYLDVPRRVAIGRSAGREGGTVRQAAREYAVEERTYRTAAIGKIADAVFDASRRSPPEIAAAIGSALAVSECRKCVNTDLNPAITIGRDGLCNVCASFRAGFDPRRLEKERRFLGSLVGSGRGKFDALVGISGGKDSTAMLYTIKRLGFTPLAFTLDSGYYPRTSFSRAKQVARALGVEHEKIFIAKYARAVDRRSFEATAALYDQRDSAALRRRFREIYRTGRQHYSVKCRHVLPFVRTCQLCRRLVVRAYYGEAVRRGVRVVVLGINEWAALSRTAASGARARISAIRKLQPRSDAPAVYVVHLPFLLQRKKADTVRILAKLGWRPPKGERIIETNANSCLFARAAESKARRLLGFHPDTTRLAREVTVGFISKKEARRALAKTHASGYSVRQVLARAGLARSRPKKSRS